ncbi:MAG: amidohydrolase family protein, partial [Pseudomonadota bacterium]
MRTWIKAPLAILADNAGGGLVVEHGKIAELVPSGSTPLAPVDATYDAGRHVVLPGLINSHHHFFQTLSRAHPGAYNKALFPWLRFNYPMWAALDRDMLRIAARLAYTELLVSGCTTATDHNYVVFEGMEDAVDIEVEEARALGIRTTVTRGSLCQTYGDMPPPEMVQDDDTVLADSERVLRRYHDTSDGAMVQIALAPCAQFSVSKRVMRESAALAERHDCRLHTHLAETLDEEEFSKEVFGYRPVDWLDDVHWMQPRTWVAHGIHFTDADIARLGAAGVGVAHCPSANAVLASGFCRTLELEAAGSTIGLGVDG